MSIWRYWCCRLVGKEPSFTPRTSAEGQTLSNGSGPSAAPANEPHIIRAMGDSERDGYVAGRKAHKTSSSTGGRGSGSISEPPGLAAIEPPAKPLGSSIRSRRDVESIMMPSSMRSAAKQTRLPAIPSLEFTAESIDNSSPISESTQQAQFYATSAGVSSQGLSSNSHSHGLLASQNDLSPPNPALLTVNDGFGVMFGAQVPQSSRTIGRSIILPQERERRLGVPLNRQRRPSAQSDYSSRDPRKSMGLPPPPRSPRPSNARPPSAGSVSLLDFGGNKRGPTPTGLDGPTSAPVATPWNWDLPFSAANASALSTGGSNTNSTSHGDQEGIELQKTQSSKSTEHGSPGQSSARESYVSENSRASVASDRTFG